MRLVTTWIYIIALFCALWPDVCPADEIVLKSGERFTSNKIWKENGKIRFNMHGLVISVNPTDVMAINGSDIGTALPAQEKVPPPAAGPFSPAPTRRPDPPSAKLTEKAATKRNPSPASGLKKPRVKGIGIDGIQWQMPPTNIPGLEKGKTVPFYGGIDQYHRTEGSLRMGEALLDGLVFGFWQNRLYTITIWVDGKPAYERLQRAVFHRHGKGQKNKTGLERYVWLDDTTDRMLEYDDKLNTGIFWMRSTELDQYLKRRYPD